MPFSGLFRFLGRLVGWGQPAGEPLDLTVPDQVVLRALLLTESLDFDDLVTVMGGEHPAISRLELLGALQKLHQAGLLVRQPGHGPDEGERYRATRLARRLQGVIPARPTVPINVYL